MLINRDTVKQCIVHSLGQCFSTGFPGVAARGSAETNRNCLGQNSQPHFYAVLQYRHLDHCTRLLENANIRGRFRCSKKVEKHWLSVTVSSNYIYYQ